MAHRVASRLWDEEAAGLNPARGRGTEGNDSHRSAGPLGPRTGSGAAEIRITRVSRCVACGFKARVSFGFTGCCWWRSLAVDGSSGASRGHASVMRRPGARCSGAVERLSVFQAGHISSCWIACWRPCLPPTVDAYRWLLPLLSNAVERTDLSVTARTVQGMARARSGQATAWPLVSGRRGCRGSDAQGVGPEDAFCEAV